ncbi:MAG: hypothetical protein JXR34_12025 [Bacteroidales bacterium]|nr:hypothetical protein [Bacteroidales bacterium]
MSTFYMSGCIPNKDNAMDYFEERYFRVEELIQTDNNFQEAVLAMSSENPDSAPLDSVEFDEMLQHVRKCYEEINVKVSELTAEDLTVIEDDHQLHRSYLSLLESYRKELKTGYKKVLKQIEDLDDEMNPYPKKLTEDFQKSSAALDESIHLFYESCEKFGETYGLEIEWNE